MPLLRWPDEDHRSDFWVNVTPSSRSQARWAMTTSLSTTISTNPNNRRRENSDESVRLYCGLTINTSDFSTATGNDQRPKVRTSVTYSIPVAASLPFQMRPVTITVATGGIKSP